MAETILLKKAVGMDAQGIEPEVGKRIILCRCPKCGSDHKMKLLWIGRGRPRKYCPLCRNTVKSASGNVHLLDLKVH